jgi:hypothetical protein
VPERTGDDPGGRAPVNLNVECGDVTPNCARLTALAPGLTPRAVLDELAGVQMLDVELPTTDGRWLVLSRYTQLESAVTLLLERLRMKLPAQPPPRLRARRQLVMEAEQCSEDLSVSGRGK